MKKRLIIFVICIGIIAFVVIKGDIKLWFNNSTAFAVGDLTVDWGIGTGDVGPIFVVNNMAPGDMESRNVEVSNGASSSRPVGIRAVKTNEISLSAVLDIVISDGITDLYGGTSPTGPKTLAKFFVDSSGPNFIALSNIGPSDTTTYSIKVTFPQESGNEFQNTQIIFDLRIGIAIEVPEECSEIDFDLSDGLPIFGTDGNDRINGTRGNDLIFALEGNDRVFGHGGDDCIVGGSGNDELRGELGDDLIFGNDGNDLLIGSVGNDQIFGGLGNDQMRGENGNDYLEGSVGEDTMTGGNGNDEMHGGSDADNMSGENGEDEMFGDEGDDSIDGGAGSDTIHGNDDNDTINGKSGSDTLIGDSGIDNINGSSGTDTCDGEAEVNCEL